MSDWLFGYGSLLWRPGFAFVERRPARLHGWVRRFWQGSHDHRGVPDAPGRVVTLVAARGWHTDGLAFRLPDEGREVLLAALDQREKNGYARIVAPVQLDVSGNDGAPAVRADSLRIRTVQCVVYVAARDNHAFLGPAPRAALVRQIVTSVGPSGRNIDYLFELAATLRRLGIDDPHVFALEHAAQAQLALPPAKRRQRIR